MTKKEQQRYKEARQICAWLEYNYIEVPDRLLNIAVNKDFSKLCQLPYGREDILKK